MRLPKTIITMLFVAAITITLCAKAYAVTESCQITLTVPELYSLVLADTTMTETASTDDFSAGYITLTSTRATVSANQGWKLSLNTSGFAAVSGYSKPITDILVKTTCGYDSTYADSFVAVAAISTDYEVATDTDPISADETTIEYKIMLDSDDIAGDYVITFVYTLTTNA